MSTILRSLFLAVVVWLWCCTIECGAVGVPVLVFPPTAPTRVQIVTGIGIPVALHAESVEMGYVLKAEYFLPENASNILNIFGDPFNVSPRPATTKDRRRRRLRRAEASTGYDAEQQQRFERYDAVAVEVDTGPKVDANTDAADGKYDYDYHVDDNDIDGNHFDVDDDDANAELPPLTLSDVRIKQHNNFHSSRFALYRGFEAIVQRNGLPGRPCMLRSICEAAHAPFSYDNGILGELAHIVMSPSTTPELITRHADGEYLRAEQLGRAGEPCGQVFRECPVSVLDKFSGMYNFMDGLMNVLG